MDIRSAMDRIVTLQGGLVITVPGEGIDTLAVAQAHKYFPDRAEVIESPGWINEWSLVEEERGASGTRRHTYIVHSQLFVQDADLDQAADIASEFFDQYMTALDADVTLNGACTIQVLRGGQPTLVTLQWAGDLTYIGLDLFLDVIMDDVGVFAA